jgi:hypothetical protein
MYTLPNYVLLEGVCRLGTNNNKRRKLSAQTQITVVVAAIVVTYFCLYAKCLTQILLSTNSYLPNTNPSIGWHWSNSFFKNEYGCSIPGQSRLIWAARSNHNLHIFKAPYCGGHVDRILQPKSIWIELINVSIGTIQSLPKLQR